MAEAEALSSTEVVSDSASASVNDGTGGQTNQSSATKEISQYLNIGNAKLIALSMVVGFILYHGVLRFKYGE